MRRVKSYMTRKRCKQCGRADVRLSGRGLCWSCGQENIRKAAQQLQLKLGPYYDKWTEGMIEWTERMKTEKNKQGTS